jgi:hypothetical protein
MRAFRILGGALLVGTVLSGCSESPERAPTASEGAGLVVSGEQKLQAADGFNNDFFGNAVSLSPTHVFIAAHGDDIGAILDQGSVYVFGRDGSSISPRQKLVASDGAANDMFGDSLASDDTTLLVGVPSDKVGALTNSGSVRVYSLAGGNFVERQTLDVSTSVDARTGSSVALTGDTAFASEMTGIRVFTRIGGSFQLTGAINGGNRRIAATLAASGDTLIAGYSCDPFDVSTCRGAAYVYVRSGDRWVQQQQLVPPVRETNDLFGASIAIWENTALVGAPGSTVNGAGLRGAAYAFVRSGSTWSMQRKLTAADGIAEDRFGSAVAVRNDIALFGAPFHEHNGINANHGSGYISTRTGTEWSEPSEVRASDGQNNDWFGSAVALSDGMMLVGSPNDDQPAAAQGSAYVFRTSGVNGERCGTGGECVTGFCSDGRCCNTACGGTCDACSVAAGAPRDGECALLAGTTPAAAACAPLTCNGSGAACTRCANDAECGAGKYCDAAGACQAQKTLGRACEPSAGADCKVSGCRVCASGNCVDGFCCNGACTGGCSSCSSAFTAAANGTCSPVRPGTDPKNACAPDPGFPDSCGADGMCNGLGQCRLVAPVDTACGDLTCSDGTLRDFGCNATGQCVQNTTQCGSGGSGGTGSGGSMGTGGSGTGGTSTGGSGGSGNGGAAGASGSAGTGGTGGNPNACIRVAPDGDDSAALASNGNPAVPFATLQPAIDFAAANPSIASTVCVADGADCVGTATPYVQAAGSELRMRNRVSVLGGFESTTWTRCSRSTEVLTVNSVGITFGSNITDESVLDHVAIVALPLDEFTGVLVDGAQGVELESVFIGASDAADDHALRFRGIDVRNGGDVTATSTTIESPICEIEGVGIHSTQGRIAFLDGVIDIHTFQDSDDPTGPFLLRAVDLVDSAASRIENSELILRSPQTPFATIDGIASSGDAQDTSVEGNSITQASSVGGRAVSFTDCLGSNLAIVGNTLVFPDPDPLPLQPGGPEIGIITGVGCIARIDDNFVRATGLRNRTSIGIQSRDGSQITNNDVSTKNVAHGITAPGSDNRGIGVSCADCAEVSGNRVTGLASIGCVRNCNVGSVGLSVSGNGTLVDGNRVLGGCSGGPTGGSGSVGISVSGSVRVQNNVATGGIDCSSAPDQAIASANGLIVGPGNIDVHSNRFFAGTTRSLACTSTAIRLDGGGARIRNNALFGGNCSTGAVVQEWTGTSTPSHFENNAFAPGSQVLYIDLGTVDPRTVEAVNALSDMVSRNNILAACAFPLISPSLCIDAGTTEGAPDHDIDGDPRGATPPDIGPDELAP